jgi:polysaccharide biosynthesis protein PelF
VATSIDVPSLPARFTVVGNSSGEPADQAPPRVLLVTEGTYPHAWGGVSTWADSLVTVLPDVQFHIVAIIAAPDLPPVFDLPSNVESVSAIPLWGVQDVKETWRGLGQASLRHSRTAVTQDALRMEFLPALRGFLHGILGPDNQPQVLAGHIHSIYRYLRGHDMRETMRAPLVWAQYAETMQEVYRLAAEDLLLPELELWELTTGMQWVTRWLYPLAAEIPEVDVVHAAMAGICTMVSVAAKTEHGAGFLLTEHGVYLRERYIAEAGRQDSYFLKMLGLRFARRMTELTYALADQISPCCDYNGRWEREVGATPEQLQTIYYGVDSDTFSADRPVSDNPRRVVWVGRINPLKDVETLLRAAAETIAVRPDVEFLLYGTAPDADADYYQRCLELHAELNLGASVVFCGFTNDPAAAFLSGDLVVLSSISEGFPYSTLEAMLCGRPVVATSVGGLPEQIQGAGIVVEPRNPTAMATAILDILNDPERCAALGVAARERAMGEFGHAKFRGRHHTSYLTLSERHGRWQHSRPTPISALAVVPEQATVLSVLDEGAHVDLARDVETRSPVPMDALEVAAVIESIGVTDRLARRRYGEHDVFTLASSLFEALTNKRKAQGSAGRVGPPPTVQRRGGGFFDAARHPAWALVPSIVLLAAIFALSHMGRWPTNRVLALAIGMSAGMLGTNGLALAMGRRASVALSLGKIMAARRFFVGCLVLGVLFTAVLSVSLSFIPWHGVSFLHTDRPVFITASIVLAVLWLTASALSLVAASGFAALALCIGLGVTVGISYGTDRVTRHHLLIGVSVGVAVAAAGMFVVLNKHAQRLAQKQIGRQRLPSAGYLMVEGLPYFLYGTLAAIMFVSVHAVGWAVLDGNRLGVATLELGLFLPLLPAVMAAGRAERTLRAFWEHAGELQRSTFASDRLAFGTGLYSRYLRQLRVYLARLLVNSLITAVVVEVLLRTHVISHIVHYGNIDDVRLLYISGLVAYGLMGLAQFNTMFALSFLRHLRPLRSLLAGTVVTIVASVVIAEEYGYQYLGVALSLGALVYALDSFVSVRPLLVAADQHYVAAV